MNDFINTTDASVWAREFCIRWPSALSEVPGKEGVHSGPDFEATMIAWFANAIMCGVDSTANRISKLEQENAQLRSALENLTMELDSTFFAFASDTIDAWGKNNFDDVQEKLTFAIHVLESVKDDE